MASNNTKVMAAAVIWISVCYLGFQAYSRMFPKLGRAGGQAQAQRQAQQQAMQQQVNDYRKELDEFHKKPAPSDIIISMKKAANAAVAAGGPGGQGGRQGAGGRGGPRAGMNFGVNTHRANQAFYVFANGARIGEVYAALRGLPPWQVTQLPQDDQRWDVRILAPERLRDQVPAKFLDHIEWKAKEKQGAAQGYHLMAPGGAAGEAPKLPEAAQDANQNQPTQGGRRGRARMPGRIMQASLDQAKGMLQGRVRAPVVVDDDIKDKQPVVADLNTVQINWQLNGDEFADQFAALFGVAVKKEQVETSSTLVYHPKYAASDAIRRWEEGKED